MKGVYAVVFLHAVWQYKLGVKWMSLITISHSFWAFRIFSLNTFPSLWLWFERKPSQNRVTMPFHHFKMLSPLSSDSFIRTFVPNSEAYWTIAILRKDRIELSQDIILTTRMVRAQSSPSKADAKQIWRGTPSSNRVHSSVPFMSCFFLVFICMTGKAY